MAKTRTKKFKPCTAKNVSPDCMPVFEAKEKIILMVMLTEFTEQSKNAFLEHLENGYQKVVKGGIRFQTWTPSKRLLSSIALQSSCRDSQANIHALAMLAHRSGLKFLSGTSFVVVDDLTKRCWHGTHRVGELGRISLLMVGVREEEIEASGWISPPPGVHVTVGRFSEVTNESNRESAECRNPYRHLDSDSCSGNDSVDSDSDYCGDYSKYGMLPLVMDQIRRGKHFLEWGSNGKLAELWHAMKYEIGWSEISDGDQGMYLHDPDQKMFSTENPASSTRQQYLKTAWSTISSRLPPELSTEIISLADLTPSLRVPLWKHRQSQEHLHIFLMFPTTESELREAHFLVHGAFQQRLKDHEDVPITAELIPLHRHNMRTRRDVVAFLQEYHTHEPDERYDESVSLNLILSPLQDNTLNFPHCAIVFSIPRKPTLMLRTSFNTLGTLPSSELSILSHNACKEYNIDLIEATHHPDQPFYWNPPIWMPGGTSVANECLLNNSCISVFYLTKHLTASEDRVLRKEIHKVNGQDRYDLDPEDSPDEFDLEDEPEKMVCFVPWERDEDGTLDDIWNITLEIYKHEGYGRQFTRFFCLDRQSVVDRTLIIVEPDFYLPGRRVQDEGELLQGMKAPMLAGFRYNRVSCEDAHETKIELERCARLIEEVGESDDEGQHFVRPGWPDPVLLPPTHPWRLDWPDPGKPGTIPIWALFRDFADANGVSED
ncbi:hypothetical protein N7520_007776 [Penicillium odoratum]|uniref:uncharacterized protein n=1 Tax=Penicillium odoratum TaxID=1167516 RepID=UPI002546787A|nr:uncharacterized protein N7520_007776 [Penicillium odoratum]KAJ5760620.1 hypothetical protein N7520_007776 [Penicillium odoratum]